MFIFTCSCNFTYFLLQDREVLDTLCSLWTTLILRNKGCNDIISRTVFYFIHLYEFYRFSIVSKLL